MLNTDTHIWFKTIKYPESTGWQSDTVIYCPICRLYHSFKAVNIRLKPDEKNNKTFWTCLHKPDTKFRLVLNDTFDLISTFNETCGFNTDTINDLPSFIKAFDFIKSLE
jgi:hypothetical protein